jgi:hypothetical protein
MKKWLVPLTASLATLAVSGCTHYSQGNPTAEYPNAEQYPQMYQAKLRSAAHWQLIAGNEARLLAERFENGAAMGFSVNPVFNSPTHSDFAVAYRHMLTEEMLNSDLAVFDKDGAYDLSYHIQVVKHGARSQWNPAPGFYSAAAGAAWFITTAVENWTRPALALVPFVIGADIYSATNKDSDRTPDTELVLTTAVRDGDRVLYSNTSVYYFQQKDESLYDGGRLFKIAAPNGA